jgi:HK97 family phage major capsid protein
MIKMEMKAIPEGSVAYGEMADISGGQAMTLFSRAFGPTIPHETCYLNPIAGIDRREEIATEFKAALTTGSPLTAISTSYSTTSGSIPTLLPTIVDPILYDLTRRDYPLASGLLPRVANQGMFADYIKRTTLPTATWKAEDAALEDDRSTYTRAIAKIKFAYAVGRITGPMMVSSQIQWQNILRNETEAQMRALRELEENTIINGDTTSTTYAYGFNGLLAAITTNTEDQSGANITLNKLDDTFQTIREAKGHPTLIVTDWHTFNDIKALMRDILIFQSGQPTLNFGFEQINFEGIPIIADLSMPTTAASRQLVVLDTSSTAGGPNIQIRTLQDAVFEELAKTNDSYKFCIKEYLTMIIVNEAWCYRVYGLA